jgi:DNA-directed RNA polymerase specialized sigma24 family protein
VTPADETTFISLWQQGASQQELAQRLGVPIGTIKSRASALARQGKIQARPKGGPIPGSDMGCTIDERVMNS